MTSLDELRRQVRELKDVQGFEATPLERLAYAVAEIGEVSEATLALDAPEDREEARMRLGMEIYDVFWNLTDLADLTGVDLQRAFTKKAALNRERAW